MSNSWAKQRQMYYGIGVAVFLLLIIIPTLYFSLHKEPTCFDGKQNQGEISIDKGGPCKLLDERTQQPLSVLWTRSFEIRDGVYSALTYIENPNPKSGIELMTYQFKLYDERGVLLAERFGRVPILPGRVVPILETNIDVGNRKVVRTIFQFLDDEVWIEMQDPTKELKVVDSMLSNEDTTPRIDATLKNRGVSTKGQVILIATVFDTVGNAFAASRTFVDSIKSGEEKTVTFTWPNSFVLPVARIDVSLLMVP